jgi:hypothetical protein
MIPAISALAIGLCFVAFALFLPKKSSTSAPHRAETNPDVGRIIDWRIAAALTGLLLLALLNVWGMLVMALGVIPAVIAKKRGYSPVKWWVYGSLLFIVALPCALLLDDKTKTKCNRLTPPPSSARIAVTIRAERRPPARKRADGDTACRFTDQTKLF